MPSSVIRKYEYNAEAEVLTITFVSGIIYDYLEVPEQVYLQMKSTLAKGIFFNQHIKDKYKWKRVGAV